MKILDVEAAGSGLLDDMMRRLPAIEATLGRPRRRMLMGESMGGLNVLIAGLSYPSRFAKIAALCPGVYTVSPFAPLSTIRAAMERTKIVAYRRARKEPGLLRGFASSRADFVARAVTRATSASSDDEAAADVELPPREPGPGDAHLV